MELRKRLCLYSVLIISSLNFNISGQDIPHDVSNQGIYIFLDELAGKQIISLNSAVKPYSRLFIYRKLSEADKLREKLDIRQQKELDFYLLDFRKEEQWSDYVKGKQITSGKKNVLTDSISVNNKSNTDSRNPGNSKVMWLKGIKGQKRFDFFYYRDSLFSLTINPILGGEVFMNSSGNDVYKRNGVEARGYIGKFGFFASLRDNHEKPFLGLPQYLTQRVDGHIKEAYAWSEMKGGITYSWKWGNAGLVKDNMQWGNNYNGANIFGGNNPSFVQLRLHISPVKWFDFNYFHGWLNSMVVDSSKSYWVTNSYGTVYREHYHNKYISANMFTFTPVKYLILSAGNSIIYDYEKINPAYLVPIFFYKSVDHSITSGIENMNSQMFFDISSRQIRNLHLYVTWFIDELSSRRFTMKDQWNFFSWKAGFRLFDLPVNNLSLTTEFTYTYPLTYQHYIPTLTFENQGYNLGYYLRDNSREWYVAFDYRPLRAFDINLFFLDAIRGPDYTELGVNRLGNPPLVTVQWHNTSYGMKATFQIINDLYTWVSMTAGNITGDTRWSPPYFYGRKNTFNLGLTYGF